MTADFNKWTDENHGYFAILGHQLLSGKKETHIVEIDTAISPLNKEKLLVESYKVTEIKSLTPNFQENIAKALSHSTPTKPYICVIVFGIVAGKKAAKIMSMGTTGLLDLKTDLSADQLVHNFNNMK
jgi:hypothetical protein